MTMKPPPPMPHENGSTTPSTPAAATAASTALPPLRRISIAVSVASGSTLAAAPPVPTATVCDVAAGAAGAAATIGPDAPTSRSPGHEAGGNHEAEETPDAVRTRAPAGRGMIAVAWPRAGDIGLILRLARMVIIPLLSDTSWRRS